MNEWMLRGTAVYRSVHEGLVGFYTDYYKGAVRTFRKNWLPHTST